MKKSDISSHVPTQASLSKIAAGSSVDALFAAISDTLEKEEAVTIAGFGTLLTTRRPSRVGAFRSEAITGWANCHREPGTVVVPDAGRFPQAMLAEDGLANTEPPALPSSSTILGNTKRSMHGTYHAVSPKGLPRYLAELSYWFNLRSDGEPE